jgi:hypothetical protein
MLNKIWLLLKCRLSLREAGLFSVIGGVISFVSDVLAVFGPILKWLLVVVVVLLAVVFVWNMMLLAPRAVTEVKKPLPPPLPLAADATLFLAITLLFSLGTFFGQIVADRNKTPETLNAQGLYASLVPAISSVQKSLGGVERDLDEIKISLKKVKLETSDDPRKELANLGVAWSGDNFLRAVKDGDERTVRLFLAGDMNPQTAESQGRPLPIMLALNKHNPDTVLDLLVGAGLDARQSFQIVGGIGPKTTTLLGRAIEKGNLPLVKALVRHGVDMNQPMETFGSMGLARQTYPLAAAIYWEQYEIANILLDAGADKSVGDYAAYREIRAALTQPRQSENRAVLDSLSARAAPTGSAEKKINLELRLKELDKEINGIFLKSLKAVPGSSERQRNDRRIQELEQERTKIRRALGMSG